MTDNKPIFYGDIDNMKCPFCESLLYKQNDGDIYDKLDIDIYEVVDQDNSAERKEEFICSECGGVLEIKAIAEISDIEYSYYVSPQTAPSEDVIKDVPGQLFLWKDIDPNEVKLKSNKKLN